MPNHSSGYNETTDIYLQILWTAQKMEDQKLVCIIKERLKAETNALLYTTEGECQVLPFPCSFATPTPIPLREETIAWPRQPLLQTLSIFGCYCSFVLLFFLIG